MRDDSPPRTPTQAKGKAPMAALDTRSHAATTFFDDETPVDKRRSGATDLSSLSRDSHDLHFRDVTRESVVDNMLLSLDSLHNPGASGAMHFGGLYSGFDDGRDDEPYHSSVARFSPPSLYRSAPHARSPSDYGRHHHDLPDLHAGRDDRDDRDDCSPSSSPSFARHPLRARRSNSTSNFRPDPDRPDPVASRGYGSARMSSDTARRPLYGEGAVVQPARGHGKKGSSSSSVDYGHAAPIVSPGSRHTNRSASFDNGYDRRPFGSDPVSAYDSVLNRGRPNAYDFPAYDAAPTPTIPTRPRRFDDSPASTPGLDYMASHSPLAPLPVQIPAVPAPSSRRNSIRSSPSKGPWNGKARGPDASIRAQATEFVNAVNIRELPPIPAFADSTTPTRPSQPQTRDPPKERRGFFSRVFGAGRSQPAQEPRAVHQLLSPDIRSPEQLQRPSTTPAQPTPLQTTPRAPTRSGPTSTPQKQPTDPSQLRTLTKKNSSFFRRRKKSVTDDPLPPRVPFQAPHATDIGTSVLPSPAAGSLRHAMKDFLGDQPPAAAREAFYDTKEVQSPVDYADDRPAGFSPDYMPHRDATIRTVRPGSRETDDGVAPAVEGVRDLHNLPVDSPKYKLKVRRGRGASSRANDDPSFLADSSEQEDAAGAPSNPSKSQAMSVPEPSRRPATSPTASTAVQHPSSGRDTLGSRQRANIGEKRMEAQPGPRAAPDPAANAGATGSDDDGWVVTTPPRRETADGDLDGRINRVWLEPTSSEEKLDEQASLSLPLEGAKSSRPSPADRSPVTPSDTYQPASGLPIVQVEGGDVRTSVEVERTTPAANSDEPTDEDRERAQQIYDGDEGFLPKGRAAAWLGQKTAASARCRKAYMEIYEWTGFSILLAMRDLCNRLVLKGETQEVDRVLDAFANRWCECNPNHGFKSSGAVHTICYSLLLLNTDLHMADIESRMTRSQFVKNTLPTIRSVVDAELEEAEENAHNSQSRTQTPVDDQSTPISPTFENRQRPSVDLTSKRSKNRLSIRPAIGLRMDSDGHPANPDAGAGDACTVLVKAPFDGPMKNWEFQVEIVLKEFYSSIKTQKLPLHGVDSAPERQSNNLTVTGVLRRTPSVLSKAPSDTTSYRGRHSELRSATARWNSKTRSRPKLYPSSTIGSSRTSLDDQSVFSPAGSSKWSTYSMGKTGTSMSVDSLGTHFVAPDYQQSIGFANALSQAIIREGNEENHTIASYEESGRTAPLLEDDSLELHGPPWAKEGILKHKHHLEAMDKKSKDRNWNEVFAVIEKGYMKIFTFNMNARTSKSRAKRRPSAGGVVGGGNWTDNAEELHSFLLRQTMASTLPPPGYSKTRPHVFALSLPTGAVHLFQAGTADIVKEYVQTANYWSARLSKEPLVGGVSNVEYGWSDNVINTALISRPESSPTTINNSAPRQSIQSSIRSSMDHGTMKPRLPGDKVVLSDWTPPAQSMMASNLMEVDQHKALTAYVKNVEIEMQRHQELRAPLMIAFSPRHPNAAKAMANFEKKSAYLLRELVKFKTYIDALDHANETRDRIYKEREERLKAEEAAKQEEERANDGAVKDEDDMSASALAQSYSSLLSAFDSPER